jgi:phosphoribosylaminoimidazolecarboxamide formyltransferase/IMP cyclohydrolase
MTTALISVYDKTGLLDFLKQIKNFAELKLIATTSTAKHLQENGFDCLKVEDLTGFPEILGGRVKTLHPHVFAGILARPIEEDKKCLEDFIIKLKKNFLKKKCLNI